MKVSELFRRLSTGQLRNLAMANGGNGTIVPAEHAQLIDDTNEALLRLFSRMTLRENDLILETIENVTTYYLRKKHAESANNPNEYAYIKDKLGIPFEEDVLQILEVYDEAGKSYPINDKEKYESLFTPFSDALQVPDPLCGRPFSVYYRARHPILLPVGSEDFDILTQEIDLPSFLEGALQNYVASLVFSHMNGQENLIKSQEYLAAYDQICNGIEEKDLARQTWHTTHDKLEQRGFR